MMSKQLDDMWTTSWVLPEHRDAMIEDRHNIKRKSKPELDDQEIQLINQAIYVSMNQKRIVTITRFDEYMNETIVGIISKVMTTPKQVKVLLVDPAAVEDDYRWLLIGEIIKAELIDTDEFGDISYSNYE